MRALSQCVLMAGLLPVLSGGLPTVIEANPPVDELYEEHTTTWTSPDGEAVSARYRLLRPKTLVPGECYPLVLFLHGAGERGSDNARQLKYFPARMAEPEMQTAFPAFVLAPQCASDVWWVDFEGDRNNPPELKATLNTQSRLALQALDDVMEREPVDADRVYLTGLSMGGYGSWAIAAADPERFAAVVPICGGGELAQAPKLVGLPIWAWHGDADRAVNVECSRQTVAAIRKAGGQVRYTELAGVGHDSWTPAYSNASGVIPWMFGHTRRSQEDQP